MKALLAALACVSLAAACSRRPAPPAGGALSAKLKTATESAYGQKPCDSVVAIGWGHTWPVPLAGPESRFSVLYYPSTGGGSEPRKLFSPAVRAAVDLGSGGPISCERLGGESKQIGDRLYLQKTMNIGMAEFQKRVDLLYDRTEAAGALYRSKAASSPENAAVLRDFLELFEELAEPDLLGHYYRENPAFWEWLRASQGRSIPKS